MEQEQDTTRLLETIEELRKENRELWDETCKLRPMARLAAVIARMERDNTELTVDWKKCRRRCEDLEAQEESVVAWSKATRDLFFKTEEIGRAALAHVEALSPENILRTAWKITRVRLAIRLKKIVGLAK